MHMSITIRPLGAAEEVTGSKHLLEVDSQKILIDCGAFQGKRAESDNKNRALLGDDVDPLRSTRSCSLTRITTTAGLCPTL
jgi:metallo-beta-lactamase family protein